MGDNDEYVPESRHRQLIMSAKRGGEQGLRNAYAEASELGILLGPPSVALQDAAAKDIMPLVHLLIDWGAEIEPVLDDEVSPFSVGPLKSHNTAQAA
ncbi:MAG: hypothetical protein STHCBS139747_006297 [Sporothrix thermara]